MSGLDRVLCDYPLADPRDQDREFVTGDFGGFGNDQYVITRDGRLVRQAPARPRENAPVRDVEWPIEGDIRIFEDEAEAVEAPIEYAVRFRAGRVEWIRRVRLDPPELLVGGAPASRQMVPEAMGRPGSAEEFLASVPRKLELVDGHIPGEQLLVLFLLTTMGLRRVASLVGRDAWMGAIEGSSVPESAGEGPRRASSSSTRDTT
jgi:hypothetical protein